MVVGVLAKNGFLTPRLPTVGGEEQEGVLGQRKKLLTAGPSGVCVEELQMIEPRTSNALMDFAPGMSRIVAAHQHRVQGNRIRMDISGDVIFVTRGSGGAKFQVRGTRRFLGTAKPGRPDILRGALKRKYHRFTGVSQQGRLDRKSTRL